MPAQSSGHGTRRKGDAMSKRYQIFISSTKKDLEEERLDVALNLLKAGFIPIGMEQFPADPGGAWTLIQKYIDECDYYVLIVAAKYGSVLPNGVSYTENEYDYAVSKGKPVFAFLHGDVASLPATKHESSLARKKKLEKFKGKLGKHHLEFWTSKSELTLKVVQSLNQGVITYPATGWIRGDAIPTGLGRDIDNIVRPCQAKGISRVSIDGIADPRVMSSSLEQSQLVRIMSTSSTRFLETYRPSFVRCFELGATVRILLPEPAHQFVTDVEESESVHVKRTGIGQEIRDVNDRLIDFRSEAQKNLSLASLPGNAEIGHYSTHLRSTMILCDERWGWLTITLPPLRAPETVSFELVKSSSGALLVACVKHFDRTWELMRNRGKVVVV